MEKFFKAVVIPLIMIAIIVIYGLLLSLPVMWLWNACLIPAIPGLQTIGWMQAWGISILCGILFKSYTSSDT